MTLQTNGRAARRVFQQLRTRLCTVGCGASLLVGATIQGCSYPGSRAQEYDCGPVVILPGHVVTGDSIDLNLRLNDTIFAYEEWQRRHMNAGLDPAALDSTYHEPVLTLMLANKSSSILQIPFDGLEQGEDGTGDGDNELTLRVGVGDTCFNDNVLVDCGWMGHRRLQFRELAAGDTCSLPYDMNPFQRYSWVEPRRGRFWVYAVYQSVVWKDTLPPVWLGRCESDTLWFTVE